MRGICAIVGVAMALMAWHSLSRREWFLGLMAVPWAVILFIAAIFGEEP